VITIHDPNNCKAVESPLVKVVPHDWHCIHDTWLHNTMKAKLGISEGLGWLQFPNITTTLQLQQTHKIHPLSTRAFGLCYDILSQSFGKYGPGGRSSNKICRTPDQDTRSRLTCRGGLPLAGCGPQEQGTSYQWPPRTPHAAFKFEEICILPTDPTTARSHISPSIIWFYGSPG